MERQGCIRSQWLTRNGCEVCRSISKMLKAALVVNTGLLGQGVELVAIY